MNKAAVIYWSGTGNTEAMAKAVAEGAKAAGADVDLLTCADVAGVESYDAIALGCPAMGWLSIWRTARLAMPPRRRWSVARSATN